MTVWKRLALMAAVLLLIPALAAGAEVRIGVLAKRGAEKAMAKWGPTGEYLSKKLGATVRIVPLKFVEIEPAVRRKEIDFVLANSAFYATLHKKYGARALLTLMNERQGLSLTEFGGVIFSRADSGIRTLEDTRGKRFLCVKFSSFGGAHMAWRLLLENGIDPRRDFASFTEAGTHDKVVFAVRDGKADVGTVRTDTLERMQAEGLIKISDFNIIHRIKSTFPFAHSTRLYPEWPLAALPHADKKTARMVAKALKLMPSDADAARAARIVGWTYAADYKPVAECLTIIGYGVFASANNRADASMSAPAQAPAAAPAGPLSPAVPATQGL